MKLSPYQAYVKVLNLFPYTVNKHLIPMYTSTDIGILPYQLTAVSFLNNCINRKGAILADETGLGKCIEALLYISQRWLDGAHNIFIVVPNNLLNQWQIEIYTKFTLPYMVADNIDLLNDIGNFEGIILVTYDFMESHLDLFSSINWDIGVFDEAYRLRNHYKDNKFASSLMERVDISFKLLLTSTPQNTIYDIYGLLTFIDISIFESFDLFNWLYVKNKDFMSLSEVVSKYCYRTLRSQIKKYVKSVERKFVTIEYSYSKQESILRDLLNRYIDKPFKKAFPKMDSYDLALMLNKLLSSSTFALSNMLKGVVKRLSVIDDCYDEYMEISNMLVVCSGIIDNSKGLELIKVLDEGFALIDSKGGNRRAVIFTDNIETQKYLFKLLSIKYRVFLYNGSNSRDFKVLDDFKHLGDILITTDLASTGLNMEFCSFVINYDLPYNIQTIEQRIGRVHRNGQVMDVLCVSFLDKENFADVRILQLIRKRLRDTNKVIGISDNVIGFGDSISSVSLRSSEEVEKDFQNLQKKEMVSLSEVAKSEEDLIYSTFDEEVYKRISLPENMVHSIRNRVNEDLWNLTEYYFDGNDDVIIDKTLRSVRFFYVKSKPFVGFNVSGRHFSMYDKSVTVASRHTITNSLARNIFHMIILKGVGLNGAVILKGEVADTGKLAFYRLKFKKSSWDLTPIYYTILIGCNGSGKQISNDECEKIFNLEAVGWRNGYDMKYDFKPFTTNVKALVLSDNIINEYKFKALEMFSNDINSNLSILKNKIKIKNKEFEKSIAGSKHLIKSLNNKINKLSNLSDRIGLNKERAEAFKVMKTIENDYNISIARLYSKLADIETEVLSGIKLECEQECLFQIDYKII